MKQVGRPPFPSLFGGCWRNEMRITERHAGQIREWIGPGQHHRPAEDQGLAQRRRRAAHHRPTAAGSEGCRGATRAVEHDRYIAHQEGGLAALADRPPQRAGSPSRETCQDDPNALAMRRKARKMDTQICEPASAGSSANGAATCATISSRSSCSSLSANASAWNARRNHLGRTNQDYNEQQNHDHEHTKED